MTVAFSADNIRCCFREADEEWRVWTARQGRLMFMVVDSLPELDVARIRKWCQQRVPVDALHQVRVEYELAGRRVTVVERRVPWREDVNPEWTSRPIARLTYTDSTRLWTLSWRDRHGRFHLYDQLAPTPKVDDILTELDHDPTGIFWG
ncbi:MAG TPA: DUF3024 domain-containing protein [Kineosporiaceae bacterium]|nr:DUF3024 domain-containing protein [Kineosporiaceae bacterium]